MCNSGFSKKFKEIAGSSPMDFIISLRIEKAEKLLLSTNLSIYDIAEK
jgi:transcriptional regulator GlxA family with amidase domain